MPDPTSSTAGADDEPDATNQGQSATEPAEGGDDAPGADAGSPED